METKRTCHLKIRSVTDNKSEAQRLLPAVRLITVLRLSLNDSTTTNLNLEAGHGNFLAPQGVPHPGFKAIIVRDKWTARMFQETPKASDTSREIAETETALPR